MNELVIAAPLMMLAGIGSLFGIGADRGEPPKPFDEKVTLQGKVPDRIKSVGGAWEFHYLLEDAKLEVGPRDLVVSLVLTLKQDGGYHLAYNARWYAHTGLMVSPSEMDGRNVTESGRFSLSGEILLLEPTETQYREIKENKEAPLQSRPNEKHALIVRLDRGRLVVAGRCAHYQVDPVCRQTPIVWFPMSAR
jgi:hypothetical protein